MSRINAKAAILEKKRKINFYKLELPKPNKNQALIKIYYSGICGSQFMEYNGNRGVDKWLPHMFGHEAVGKVIVKGKAVTKVKSNDLVMVCTLYSHCICCLLNLFFFHHLEKFQFESFLKNIYLG